jgi:hypothetical protein
MVLSTPFVVHDPTVQPDVEAAAMARRPQTLDGMVLGLLANRKRNADALLKAIGDVLAERFRLKGMVVKSKTSSSKPCPPGLKDALIDQCDAVIIGVGDCGSCASYSVYDAIGLEKNGIPTAVLVTEPLASVAEAMSEFGGIPGYPFVEVAHPIGSLTPGELRERAQKALPYILEILTGVPE